MHYIKGNKNQGAGASTFQNASSLRLNMTSQEKKVWDRIKNKQLYDQKFRRQHTISSYILDFFCVQCKLSIEIDGASHAHSEQIEYDNQRTIYLNEIGISELRFTNKQVDCDLDGVLNKIRDDILKFTH